MTAAPPPVRSFVSASPPPRGPSRPRSSRPGHARRDDGVPERQRGPARRGPGHPRGRLRVHRRAVGRRQVHPDAADHPRRGGDRAGVSSTGRISRGCRAAASRRCRKIGTIFQDFKLLPRKSVWENVAFALEVTGTPRRRIRPAVDRVLALVGLTAQARQSRRSCPGRAAADRDRACPRPRPADHHRRRADGQPRPADQLGDPAAPAADQRARRDGPDGDPQRGGRDRPAAPRRRARGGPDHPRRGGRCLPPRGLSGDRVRRLQSQARLAGLLAQRGHELRGHRDDGADAPPAGRLLDRPDRPAGGPPVHRAEGRGRRLPAHQRQPAPGRPAHGAHRGAARGRVRELREPRPGARELPRLTRGAGSRGPHQLPRLRTRCTPASR